MSEPEKQPEQHRPAYESDDISFGRLLGFAAGVAGLVVLGVLASAAVFHFFVQHQPLGPPASPFEDIRPMPPEPRLQTNAPQDLDGYHKGQNQILNTYGWVDQQTGVVRIPVERAMDILLQKGYPSRGTSPAKGGAARAPATAAAPPNRSSSSAASEGAK